MARRRWTLTESERADYRTIEARLRAGGADLGISGSETAAPAWMTVRHCATASYVRSWPGATVLVIYVRIVGLARKTIVRAFELWSPAWELNAYLLDDPAVRNSAQQFYRLLDQASFHRSEILNHRVGPKRVLRHGDLMEGMLLAQSFSSAPTRYDQRCPMPLTISIINQHDDVHEFQFELPVEHVARRVQPRPPHKRGLFEPAEGPSNGSAQPAPDFVLKKQQPGR